MPIPKRIQFMRRRPNGRSPANNLQESTGTPLRITRLFPMKLKDVTVDSLKEQRRESNVVCIQELMTLFDCFEKSDYNTQLCQAQATALEQCYSTNMKRKHELKAARKAAK